LTCPFKTVWTILGVENVVICGIEGHVCVKSTVFELLKRGIHTHVVVDAVSSRSMVDRYVDQSRDWLSYGMYCKL